MGSDFLHHPVLVGVVLSLILAGFTKGAIGVGMPIVALPLLMLFVDVKMAVVLLTVPLIVTNIPQALEGGKTTSAARDLLPVLFGIVPGLLAGVYVLLHSSTPIATFSAGIALILVAALMLASAKVVIPEAHSAGFGTIAGFLGGILGGVAALPGPIVFMYLIGRGLRGKAFTKEASLFLVIASGMLAIILGSSESVSSYEWGLSVAALMPVGLGMLFGQRLRDWISPEAFKRLVLIVVILSGAGLVKKAWAQHEQSQSAPRQLSWHIATDIRPSSYEFL